jgi:restriction system protein
MSMNWSVLALGAVLPVGALLWYARRRLRHGTPASTMTPPALRQLRTSEFVRLVGLAFQARGFHVVESGVKGARADGAIDIELRKDREAHLVHCKHWRSRKIDVDAVRAFHLLMTERRAAGGYIVTTGRFSRDAMHYVRGISLSLIDGALLGPMLDEGRYVRAAEANPSVTVPLELPKPVEWAPESVPRPDPMEDTYDFERAAAADTRPPAPQAPPRCPLCSAAMVMRTAPAGKHAGRMFWRCSRRRECKGLRPLV